MKLILISCIILNVLESAVLFDCPNKCRCQESSIECHGNVPTTIPRNVTKVILKEIQFGEKFEFKESWKNVTFLSINPGVSVFHNQQEAQRSLKDQEFADLLNLEYLQIACKCLRGIQKRAFYGLEKLRVLDLSNNIDLNKTDLVTSIGGENLPVLKELYLSNISVIQVNRGSFIIGPEFYDAVRNKPLEILDLSEIEDAWFDSRAVETAFPFLKQLNISGAGTAVLSFSMALSKFGNSSYTSFRKLKILDVSYPLTSSKFSDLFFGRRFYEDTFFYAPNQLEEVFVKRYFTSPVKLNGIANSTHLCLLPQPEESNIKVCVIANFKNLRKAVLTENSLVYINPNLTYTVKSLKYLDLSKNELGNAVAVDGYALSMLEKLTKLEVLLAAENKITSLPFNTFKYCQMLRIIDLSHNFIETITFETDYLMSLRYLDLRSNRIFYLDSQSIERLDKVLQVAKHNMSGNRSANISFDDNPLACSCESVLFLNWLMSLNKTLSCTLNSEEAIITDHIVIRARYECYKKIVIISFSVVSLIEIIIILAMVKVVHCEFRKIKQRRKLKLGVEKYEAIKNKRQHPAVYLSFSAEEDDTVTTDIYPKLNAGLMKILKTESRCVATSPTDLRLGFYLANEIIICFESIDVLICFVTKSFCKDSWCKYEALVAQNNHKAIVIMHWEDVAETLIPKHLLMCYKDCIHVHWKVKNGQRVMKPGWQKLCEDIVGLIGVPSR